MGNHGNRHTFKDCLRLKKKELKKLKQSNNTTGFPDVRFSRPAFSNPACHWEPSSRIHREFQQRLLYQNVAGGSQCPIHPMLSYLKGALCKRPQEQAGVSGGGKVIRVLPPILGDHHKQIRSTDVTVSVRKHLGHPGESQQISFKLFKDQSHV